VNLAGDLSLLARVTGGLVVVLVVVAVVARLARRARGVGKGEYLRVVERIALSREVYVAVVQAGGRSLLIGVTPQGIAMLAQLDVPPGQQPVHVVLETARPPGEPPRRPTTPPAAPTGAATERRDVMPPGVDLTGHPDLASALRAAGRTTGQEPADAAAPGDAARTGQGSTALPRRADLRRGRRAQAGPAVPQQRQASGSVLSPRAWRQGIDALREATVRRG
jgi:flagellar biogenesis protein FliO